MNIKKAAEKKLQSLGKKLRKAHEGSKKKTAENMKRGVKY